VIKRTSLFMTLLVAVVVTLAMLTVLSISVMSILQACTSAESLWSKSQQEAIYQLTRYAERGQEDNYNQFLTHMRIPAGYQRARLEMNKPEPDMAIARQGFIDGGVAPIEIDGMLTLYRHLKWQPDIARAFRQWELADMEIARLRVIGSQLQAGFTSAPQRLPGANVMTEINHINDVLKPLKVGFSSGLGDASRLIRNLLIIGFSSIALLLIGGSLFLAQVVGARSARLESQLRKSEERLTLGFIGSGAGLWDWDIRSDNVYYSPWISTLLGYEEGMLDKAPSAFMEMMHPDDRAACRQAAALHFRESARYDVAFRLKTGDASYLWCRSRGQVVRDDNGIPVRMVGTLTDISDLKEAEALAFSEKELAQVALAAIADAVITTDIAGNITYCNRVAEALLGRTIASLRNRPLSLACRIFSETSGQQISDLVGPSIDGIDSVPLEDTLLLHRLDGQIIPIDHSVATIRNFCGSIIGAVVVLHDVSEARQHAAELTFQANHDALTGILNRRAFEAQLNALIRHAIPQQQFAVLYLDLDQFKVVNDTCGHAAGDELISQISMVLQQNVRDGDLLARLGGDEFGVVLMDCGDVDAIRIAEQLRESVASIRFAWAGQHFAVGVSVGLVAVTHDRSTLKEVMKAADAACYMAKEKGRNRVHVYRADDIELTVRHHEMTWVARIKNALERDRFCLYAQAIVSLRDGIDADTDTDTGHKHVEILLRMLDDDDQPVAPMAFIPAAERYGLITQIDRWVIRNTFKVLALPDSGGISTCAINLSGGSIDDDHFFEYVLEQQRLHQVAWSMLCFEITETAAIASLSKAAALITRLRDLGCRFALDDFGTGMSSFSYLKHLPVDYLKIDGSFVKDMLSDPTDRAMVDAINNIGHVMGKQTIAEFVENDAILVCLREMGVDYAQGYGIGKPEPLVPACVPNRPERRISIASTGNQAATKTNL
jgi:diguanylate cyclase (GGDEF)-like protein/PAS domain S-box-containing protein